MKPGDLVYVGKKYCSVPLMDVSYSPGRKNNIYSCTYIEKRELAVVLSYMEDPRTLVLLLTSQGVGWVNSLYVSRAQPEAWCK